MHTILLSRGNFQYRQKLKKMQDGEIFLEDFIAPADWKNSRVKLWAQLGNPLDTTNPGPIDVTDWLDRALQTHSHLHLVSGHRLNSVGEVPVEDQLPPRGDGKYIPHGATFIPYRYRIAAYNGDYQLSTEDATTYLHAVNLHQLQDMQRDMEQLIDDTNKRFKDWIEWVIGGTFDIETGQWHGPDEEDKEAGLFMSNAANQLNQIFELAKALNNDPNAFNTIMTRITTVDTILKETLAQLQADMIEAVSNLTQQITTVNNDLTQLRTDLNQAVSNLTQQITTVNNDLQADLTQLRTDLNQAVSNLTAGYMPVAGGTFTGPVYVQTPPLP
jgi:methyl-accepting chemotaxis protein